MSASQVSLGALRAPRADTESRPFALRLATVSLILAGLLAWAGSVYLSRQQAEARGQAHRELSAIADLKLRQILDWRRDRLSDARFFSQARFVARDVQALLQAPQSPVARSAVLDWLQLLKSDQRYSGVTLFDPQGERLLALPETTGEPPAYLAGDLKEVRQRHAVVMTDLHRDEANGFVHIDIVFPIFENADANQSAPIAFVLLKLDARQFLFPLVQSWPVPSPTAETLLVRRDGADVLYLNDLRHRTGTALVLRQLLSAPALPAAKVLRGDTHVLEGVDYRGVPVVAVGRLVPGTSWALIAKMDRQEVYTPLRRQSLTAAIILATLLLAGALLVALLWRQRSARFLKRELAAAQAHERAIDRMNRLYAALSQVNQAVVRARSREQLLRQMCHVLVQFGGFQMAWVGWLDSATSRVTPVAQCGDDGYPQWAKVLADDRPEGREPVGTAIREGRPRICNALPADPTMQPSREAVPCSDGGSLAAFPIRQEGHICGALAVYAREQGFFGQQEQALIEEAAGDVSFGIDTLLTDQKRRRAEQDLAQARDALARANTGLEQKVRERTAQLVEANANLQTFAHTAAHDLRSPLRTIKGFTSIVLSSASDLGQDTRSLLERVSAAADQMARLLEDLLEFSKMSQAELKLEPVSLASVLAEVLALLEAEIRARHAAVSVREPMPRVLGHPATLLLLINNLLSNALKFVPPGVPPQIRTWTEQTGGHVRLSVLDNGIGIAPEDQERIFGAFQRLHGKQAYPGTGLGLAIVRKGAERMDGRVGVQSEPGKGSCFWLEFNAAPSA
jgi:signal transduction histidine kinase